MEELVNVQPHTHVRDCLDEHQNTPPLLISNVWNPEVAQLWHFNLQRKKNKKTSEQGSESKRSGVCRER